MKSTISDKTKKFLKSLLGDNFEELPQYQIVVKEFDENKDNDVHVISLMGSPVTLASGQLGPCC